MFAITSHVETTGQEYDQGFVPITNTTENRTQFLDDLDAIQATDRGIDEELMIPALKSLGFFRLEGSELMANELSAKVCVIGHKLGARL